MKQSWSEVKSKYESLAKRERILLLAACIAIVYMLFELIMLKPLDDRLKLAIAQQQVAAQVLNTTEAELLVLKSLANKEPFAPLKEEKRRLAQSLAELDEQLTELNQTLISAEELPRALQFLLHEAGDLKLKRFHTSPATGLLPADDSATVKSRPQIAAGNELYRHQVFLELEGTYQQFIDYLQTIESSDWRFSVQSMHYRFLRGSTAQMDLLLYTLTVGPGPLDG